MSAALFSQGASGVQEDFLPGEKPAPRQPWDTGPPPPRPKHRVLIAWFEDPDTRSIERALPAEATEPTWADVVMQDWENDWKKGFEPMVISPTLTIAPPWDAPEGALIVEPGQGFGTGQHASTRGALRLMDALLPGPRTCLDVGCGSGILALFAAREGAETWGIDVEASAVREAGVNASRNGLQARFDTTPLDQVEGSFDLIAANLHAELLVRLAEDLLRVTASHLVCAGILRDREALVRERFDPELQLVERLDDGSWVALHYRRPDR